MSISAYKRTIRSSETPREIERQIFSRITAALASSARSYDEAEGPARMQILAGTLQPALAENIRLWSLLRRDLSAENNQLPAALRAQLISLALFVERQTTAILRGEGSVSSLVALNTAMIGGLAGLPPETEAA